MRTGADIEVSKEKVKVVIQNKINAAAVVEEEITIDQFNLTMMKNLKMNSTIIAFELHLINKDLKPKIGIIFVDDKGVAKESPPPEVDPRRQARSKYMKDSQSANNSKFGPDTSVKNMTGNMSFAPESTMKSKIAIEDSKL